MIRLLYLARFFIVVPPIPSLLLGAFLIDVAIASLVVAIDPSKASGALTPVLMLQLFASASGFDVPARRGHYDLLLARGLSRRRIAMAHWTASALPGILAWLVLAGVQKAMLSNDQGSSLFNGGTLSALLLVSTVPWAITLRLPRFSGAIGWLVTLATMAVLFPGILALGSVQSAAEGRSAIVGALRAVLYPPLLVGADVSGAEFVLMVPSLALSLVAMTLAVRSVDRRDIPLEAAQ